MRVSRSRVGTRIAATPVLIPITGLMLLTLLALTAGLASGQTSTRRGATADTSDGFRVRVKEEGRTEAQIRADREHQEAVRAAEEARRAGHNIPDPPEPPDVPEPPDIDFDAGDNAIVRFGEDITIPADKVIDGDVVAIGGNVIVYGRVKGDCVSVGGTVDVRGNGVVEGDAVSMGGGVSTSDSGTVSGSNVSLGSPFERERFWPMVGLFGAVGTGIWLFQALVKLALTLFFAWVALLLARERLVHAVDVMYRHFGRSFLWGLAGFAASVVALPAGIILLIVVGAIAAAILAITIIGIPVAILLIIAMALGIAGLVLALLVAVFLGFLNGSMFLGQRVLGRESARGKNPLIAILVGTALLTLLEVAGKLISVVGVVVFHPIAIALGIAAGALAVIVTIAGFGAMIMTRFAAGPHGEGALGSQWWTSRKRSSSPGSPGAGVYVGGFPREEVERTREEVERAVAESDVADAARRATPPPQGGQGTAPPPGHARPPGAPPDGSSDAP
jgi:hypothetical protein